MATLEIVCGENQKIRIVTPLLVYSNIALGSPFIPTAPAYIDLCGITDTKILSLLLLDDDFKKFSREILNRLEQLTLTKERRDWDGNG